MTPGSRIANSIAAAATGQVRKRSARRGVSSAQRGWSRWLGEPRNTVFLVMAAVLSIGGGRKLLQWWRARAAVERLSGPNPTVADVEAASGHGRAPLMDLFRILTTAESEPLRQAAGRALAVLWGQDELIVEEEKALVLRGFAANWQARRRYPRQIHAPIPISIAYGVPFLSQDTQGVGPGNLEWSHRVLGTRRATHETLTDWKAGAGHAEIDLIPGDFDTNGPHRLVLQPRVRTRGLTGAWVLDLPQIPFHIEFDPALRSDALFTLADASRQEAIARALRLERVTPKDDSGVAEHLPINKEFAFRDPPRLLVTTPLPCDLAHSLELEVEGLSGQYGAGTVVLSGQGVSMDRPPEVLEFALGPIAAIPDGAIDRPGTRRIRAVLKADPDRGWGDPDIRSIWPGELETEWVDVEVVRL